ncbi:MAG: OmpA family protein, partial [Rhodothermales bacterium]
ELSGARASSVVRFFLEQQGALVPEKYKTVGFGEFRPVSTNETNEGRVRNRRVEILFSHAGTD